jgi:hypothetical protein
LVARRPTSALTKFFAPKSAGFREGADRPTELQNIAL